MNVARLRAVPGCHPVSLAVAASNRGERADAMASLAKTVIVVALLGLCVRSRLPLVELLGKARAQGLPVGVVVPTR